MINPKRLYRLIPCSTTAIGKQLVLAVLTKGINDPFHQIETFYAARVIVESSRNPVRHCTRTLQAPKVHNQYRTGILPYT